MILARTASAPDREAHLGGPHVAKARILGFQGVGRLDGTREVNVEVPVDHVVISAGLRRDAIEPDVLQI